MTAALELLNKNASREAGPLQRRMTALGLDVGAWSRFQPAMLREMQSACDSCRSRVMCTRDQLQHVGKPAWPGWREYCPVAAKLDMMVALQFY